MCGRDGAMLTNKCALTFFISCCLILPSPLASKHLSESQVLSDQKWFVNFSKDAFN